MAGWDAGLSVDRSIGSRSGLWEVRSRLTAGRIARVLFCIEDGQMILLHGFIKKTQRTPKSDLDLAARRLREVAG